MIGGNGSGSGVVRMVMLSPCAPSELCPQTPDQKIVGNGF